MNALELNIERQNREVSDYKQAWCGLWAALATLIGFNRGIKGLRQFVSSGLL